MTRVLLGGMAALAMVTSAMAADLPARTYNKAPMLAAVMYDWSGFYIGGNGGWGASDSCWDYAGAATARLAANLPHGCHDSNGGTAGGQIGYNWQTLSWVFGVEAQGNWADFGGSHVSAIWPISTVRSRTDAFGLFTGRIGYAWHNALLSVRGGAAVASNTYDFYPTLTGVVSGETSDTRWGAAVGVGVEYGLTPNWSLAVQYDHLFLGERDVAFSSTFGNSVDRIRQDVDLVTARINYRWGGPVLARY